MTDNVIQFQRDLGDLAELIPLPWHRAKLIDLQSWAAWLAALSNTVVDALPGTPDEAPSDVPLGVLAEQFGLDLDALFETAIARAAARTDLMPKSPLTPDSDG